MRHGHTHSLVSITLEDTNLHLLQSDLLQPESYPQLFDPSHDLKPRPSPITPPLSLALGFEWSPKEDSPWRSGDLTLRNGTPLSV